MTEAEDMIESRLDFKIIKTKTSCEPLTSLHGKHREKKVNHPELAFQLDTYKRIESLTKNSVSKTFKIQPNSNKVRKLCKMLIKQNAKICTSYKPIFYSQWKSSK